MATPLDPPDATQSMFHAVVQGAPVGMLMVDLAGRIILVNAETERLLGYPRAELLGRSVEILVPPRVRDSHVAHRRGFLESPVARVMGAGRDLTAVRKDGVEIPVEIGLNPIETPGGWAVMATIVDITGRKNAETEIRRLKDDLETRVERRTRELRAAAAEMEEITYTVSHDLRAPLRHILAYADALGRLAPVQADPSASDTLEKIRSAAGRMGFLVDELLEFARIGASELRLTTFPLGEVVREVRAEAERHGPRAAWSVGDLGMIRADRDLLKLALADLVDNALKFSRTRSEPRIEISLNAEPGQVVVTVSENGAGFDPAFTGKLFGVFQRLHGPGEFEGIGIGLAKVRRAVTRHGGRVWAEGEPGVGASFHFSLPHQG